MKYNQKIIDLKKVDKDNPYYITIKFLNEIAQNLEEKSRLFEILYEYNSCISEDISVSNKKGYKNRKDTFKYELNMITVDELKNYIIKIFPNFIIKYTYDNDDYAFYNTHNDIIFVNELKIFKIDDINYNGYSSGGYIIPLVALLIHECWLNAKTFSINKERNSLNKIHLASEHFKENIIKDQKEDNKRKNKDESGCEIESLILGKRAKNNIYVNYLLSDDNIENDNLLDVNLWIQPDFKNLKGLILKNIKKISDNDINRDFNKNEGERRFFEGTYLIDGVEIGPLFKV